ncbi:hypothetical protein [Argonema antarcticum]|uniref:hypothetical protein n=1 Tax=Argonema antarcticum TaxID=2942763 RepID=UPI002012B99A|nr:hypothetical protein [Argonema antarcticum]MCL1475701.1 hypothetical protein [Argonema antarcticum A004/B2]
MPRPKKAESLAHGERKVPRQFMITPTSDQEIESAVEETGLSRSELMERALKAGAMLLVTNPEALKKLLQRRSKPLKAS